MGNRTVKFDLSEDTLLDIAEAKLDGEDYLSALRMLHKALELYGPGADEYGYLADAYDAMELFEESVNCWYACLDVCDDSEKADAYEGLAACYYNLGNDRLATYYYNLMLQDKYVSEPNNIEMEELLEKPPKKPFKITWPPERADYSDIIDEGLKALKSGKFAKAESCFQKIHSESEYYLPARNFLAVCYLLQGEAEKAERECLKLLESAPQDVQALSTYAAVLIEQERREEARTVAEKLARVKTENPDELYKIATVCCENELYEEAYARFERLEKDVRYDHTLLYFKAVAAFRCGKLRESLAGFGKLLDVYPNAAVARYYYRAIQTYAKEGGEKPETAFFYRVPAKERERRVRILTALASVPVAELRAYCEQTDPSELLIWCLDEMDHSDIKLQMLALRVAVRGGQTEFIRNLLLNAQLNDLVKAEAVRLLCEGNKDLSFRLVVSDIFREIRFTRLEIGRVKRSKFVGAYALCVARFVLFDETADVQKFRIAAQALYGLLEEAGKLELAKNAESVAFVLYLTVTAVDFQRAQEVMQYLGADGKTVAELLRVTREAAEALKEAAVADANRRTEQTDDAEDAAKVGTRAAETGDAEVQNGKNGEGSEDETD